MIDEENIVEEWKDAVGYEGYYQVSNLGRVKSVNRIIVKNNKVEYPVKERILKLEKNRCGYFQAHFCKVGIHRMIAVHRLVSFAFISRTNEALEVNHKDENKTNNQVDNLEWISKIENIRYGTRTERVTTSKSKPVIQMDLNGNVIKVWKSMTDIERTLGFYRKYIGNACTEKIKTCYGFRWEFIENE